MKNTINVSNNANLILYTYRYLLFKLLLRFLCCLKTSFDHAMQNRRVTKTRQRGNGKVLQSAAFGIRKP